MSNTDGAQQADAVGQVKKGAEVALFGGMIHSMWNMAPECPGCGNPQGSDLDCLTCVFRPSRRSALFIPKEHPNHP